MGLPGTWASIDRAWNSGDHFRPPAVKNPPEAINQASYFKVTARYAE